MHSSAAAARQYYTEGLKREDYYSESQEVVGKWQGRAAALLGLGGDVRPEAFAALVENRHPTSGEKLTPRMKADRRVGYDINFHAPKSLSVLQALMGDERITKVFRDAVTETMVELEERVGTRVRKGGCRGNRVTGNMVWAEFVHFTARPVGGIPDPHLHVHCFTFNLTRDQVEDRWKAAEFHDLKKEAPYAEAAFHSRLAGKVAALGYGVERTRTGWEVAGVPASLIEKFSRRTALIEKAAADLGMTGAKAKDALGALTREGKRRGLTHAELLGIWGSRLTPEEKALLTRIRFGSETVQPQPQKAASAKEAVDHAFEKCFARDSVVLQTRLVGEALKFGVGGLQPESLWRELANRQMVVRKVQDELFCTTLDVLAEEISLVGFVRAGRGKHAPIHGGRIRFGNEKLSAEQKHAVRSILTSTSQVIALRGAAGVGKTTLMQEAATQIETKGLRIFAFAPSAAASRETLREAGFAGANTVAHLLQNARLQQQVHGNVIWIDEAGMLGVRDLWQIMKIAGPNTRVILTGDSGQHAPVARGDAFRLIENYAGLPVIEVTTIRRQERESYRQAVKHLSQGDLAGAFRRLDELGAIVEIADEAGRYRQLAADYLTLGRKGTPPLVVSPTHAESAAVTGAIRQARREAGQLGEERQFIRYKDLQWDNADKKLARNYRDGLFVQFHQNAKGILRGEMFQVKEIHSDGRVNAKSTQGKSVILPIQKAERFQVFEAESIHIAKGEQIRITRNGTSQDGRRLNNGNVFTVEKFTRKGNILLSNGAELDARHGHFTYGYCQTSHSSQSKSVRHVLVAQSDKSFVASSREQFYVSVSRGKESVRIYTDDRLALKEAVGVSSTRLSGIELAGLTPKEISAMSEALNSKQWREAVKSRVQEGDVKNHLHNVLRERRQAEPDKAKNMSWRGYVEMRRGLVGPDGKSRSKGHPQPPEKRNGSNLANKRRSFLRPTEHTEPVKRLHKAAHEKKKAGGDESAKEPPKAPKTRLSRMKEVIKSAADHFQKVKPSKKGEGKQPGKKDLQASSLERAAKHAVKARAAEHRKATGEQMRKAKEKTQKAAPPPPTPKK